MSNKPLGSGRRFSAIKGRMSITSIDGDMSPVGRHRMRRARGNTAHTDASLPDLDHRDSSNTSGPFITPKNTMRSMTVPDIDEMVRPDSMELNQRFEEALENMGFPDANKDALRKQTEDKKWALIKMYETKQKKVEQKKETTTAPYWIKKMQKRNEKGLPEFTKKDALVMQSVFRTSHKDFLADFIEGFAGVKALNALTNYFSTLSKKKKKEAEVLSALIDSYKLLMNNEIGMEGVLIVKESIQTIAMAMDYYGGNHQLTEKVVTLLSVACWWKEKARETVMRAMKYMKTRYRELSTFQTIVYLFEHNNDPSFQASIATFITTVCNTPPTIEKRVSVRNHFYRLDIIKIFEKVMAKKDKPKSHVEEQAWKTIETQFEVFVAMMRQDQKEIVHKLIIAADKDDSHFNLSNLQDSWKLLQKNALKADCQDELLNVVQALFLVPTVNSLAVPIYESIGRYVFEATSIDKLMLGSEEEDKGITDAPDLNYDELNKLLKHKIEYDAKCESFSERSGLVKRQQKLIKILQKRLVDILNGVIPPDRALDLQEELIKHQLVAQPKEKKSKFRPHGKQKDKKKKEEPVSTDSGPKISVDLAILAGLGITDTASEIEIMKERENKLKAEVDALQKKVQQLTRGGKLVPAGTAGAGGGAAAPAKPASNLTGAAALIAGAFAKKGGPVGGGASAKPEKLDSTGLAPAGILPGAEKKDPPPVPKKGMPGSLENAPVEYVENAPKKVKNPFGPGGPPGPKGGPPGGRPDMGGLAGLFAARSAGLSPPGAKKKPKKGGGGLEALFGKKAAALKPKKDNARERKIKAALGKLGLEPKPKIKPTKKMTQVFWNVIDPATLGTTLWIKLSDQDVKFNTEELESLFAKKVVAKKEKKKEEPKVEVIKLIDGKRRQNLAIALRKLKLETKEIIEALTKIDTDVLSADKLEVFIGSAPTPDELALFNKFSQDGSDPKKLAEEEKYLFALRQIPGLPVRLKCIKTSYTFNHDAKRVHTAIVRMKKAVAEVNGSKELRKVLEVVLAVGNYMNGGTTRGAAWGFKLDILGGLINIKDSMNNGTLMHYLFVLFERNYPELTEFSLPKSGEVVNISFKEVSKELNTLSKQVGTIKQQAKKKKFTSSDRFAKRLGPFEVKASRDIEKLQKLLEGVRKDFESLALSFGESGPDVEPKTFFPKLVSFEQGLKRAGTQLSEMREAEARKRKAQEQKTTRNTVRKLKKLLQASTNAEGQINMDLIEMFKSQQSQQTKEVVEQFLAKYERDLEQKTLRNKAKKKSRKRPGP